jgi:hypothetical protein
MCKYVQSLNCEKLTGVEFRVQGRYPEAHRGATSELLNGPNALAILPIRTLPPPRLIPPISYLPPSSHLIFSFFSHHFSSLPVPSFSSLV